MSYYGENWSIDGVIAGILTRNGLDGYRAVFEREYASLEQIESINWDAPVVKYIGIQKGDCEKPVLPEGYSFEVTDVEYQNEAKTFNVYLKTKSQFLGDITGYQAEIDKLTTTMNEQSAEINSLQNQLAETDALVLELYESQNIPEVTK